MATLIHLAQQNQVVKLEAALSWREQEDRQIYVFPHVRHWMEDSLPNEASNWNLELSPLEQLDNFLSNYCSGRELMFERQFRPIRHIKDGIWELKTADVRLFGWFKAQDCFVCTDGNTAFNVKEHGLYWGYAEAAAQRRNHLDLDGPKFVPGDDPNDVISAFSYPPQASGG
ncbi:MAG: hypothetical protein R3E09_02490 [Novosphingobium sp.]|nr:hypothetical protein [Novosphingobium sp.]MCB2077531.1 hypothetical protein [Novosphingobium sp.]